MNDAIPVRLQHVTKRFGTTTALDRVSWEAPRGAIVGLVGRNGSGKSTLLRTVVGSIVATEGTAETLGAPAHQLNDARLARIGYVDQAAELLDWLTIEQHVRYVAAFQPHWDEDLERRLRRDFDLEGNKRVAALSQGMRQRLALLLAVCHRPELLLLDEPVSALDPFAREDALRLILERAALDGVTVVVSSHVLTDVEKVVDRLLVLEAGRVVEDASLDELKESYAEWIVRSASSDLPSAFPEPYVLAREGDGRTARLTVRADPAELALFRSQHGVDVEVRAMDLERIFPFVVGGRRA